MNAITLRLLALVLTAGFVLTLGGCAENRLKQERSALYQQNQELQSELNRARSALESSEADRNALAQENGELRMSVEDLRTKQAAAPAPAAGVARSNTGFDAVEGVETIRGASSITVRIPGDVLFDSGKITLRSAAQNTLKQVAGVLNREYGSNTIRVEGYTDTDPIKKSNWADNLELSLERSAAVHRYLEKNGVSKSRMYAAGFGDTRPRDTKARSRRVEIVVLLSE